ncbi:MAG: hypothetical protein K6G61_09315 [Solobacterium sp.]|nr:hypothetical protein [Solobacterium sp.]
MRTVTFCFDTNNLTYNIRETLAEKMRRMLGACTGQTETLYRLFLGTELIRSAYSPDPGTFLLADDLRSARSVSHYTDLYSLMGMRDAVMKDAEENGEYITFIFADHAFDASEVQIAAEVYVIGLDEDSWYDRTECLLHRFLDTEGSDRPPVSGEDIYGRGRYMTRFHRNATELMTGIELLKLAAFRADMVKASKELLFAYENFFTDRGGLRNDIIRAAELILLSDRTDTDECIAVCRRIAELTDRNTAARMLKRLNEERNVTSSQKALIVSLANTYVPDTFEPLETLAAVLPNRDIYEVSSYLYRYFDEEADDSHFFWLTVPAAALIRERYNRNSIPYENWLERVKNSSAPFREEILEYFTQKEQEEESRRRLIRLRYEADMESLKNMLSGDEDAGV